jgi:hypothetical protein
LGVSCVIYLVDCTVPGHDVVIGRGDGDGIRLDEDEDADVDVDVGRRRGGGDEKFNA